MFVSPFFFYISYLFFRTCGTDYIFSCVSRRILNLTQSLPNKVPVYLYEVCLFIFFNETVPFYLLFAYILLSGIILCQQLLGDLHSHFVLAEFAMDLSCPSSSFLQFFMNTIILLKKKSSYLKKWYLN